MENQNNDPGQRTINIQVPSAENIASRRPLIPASFALAIILFFFSFFELRCGGEKVESIKGINLVTGKVLKGEDLMGGDKNDEKIPANFWAILSFSAAIVGFGAFMIKEKKEALIGTGAGIIGFGALFILQIDVKSKISKQMEGQINTITQFPYWLALIALGVAGIVSYLRMKKTYNPIPIASTPAVPITTQPESISQTKAVESLVPQINNFDIGNWLNKNKKIIIGIIALILVLFGVYYFFLKHDPVKDARKVATGYCNCAKKQNEQTANSYKKYIAEFESYKFSGKEEAQQKLEGIVESLNAITQECYNDNQERLSKLKGRYIGDKTKESKFNYAYSTQLTLCNSTTHDLSSLYDDAASKINQYIGPVEREQARQDSIAAVKASEIASQQVLVFVNATKTPPSIDRMKQDILGKDVKLPINNRFGSWLFGKLEDIIESKIIGMTFQNDNYSCIANTEMKLYDNNLKQNFSFSGLITYTWDFNSSNWIFQNIVAQEFHKIE